MSELRSRWLIASRPDVGSVAEAIVSLVGYECDGTMRDAKALAAASLIGEALIRHIKHLGG